MDESSKSRRGETREFWEAAIRLWNESGLSVRDFCNREGLTEQSFYSWRRDLMPKCSTPMVGQEPSAAEGCESPANGGRRHRPKPIANPAGTNTSAVEFLPVRLVGEKVPRANAASGERTTGAAPIEIVGPMPWRVRIPAGFDPTTLDAVLTVLERRPC